MQSLVHLAKLFFCAFVATAHVLIFSTLGVAQVYQVRQVRPDGSLIYQPRYVNPNFQQYSVKPPTIYPGQIINGERVIGPSSPAPLGRPQAVNPPQPPASNSDRKNQNLKQQSQRPKTASEINVPIPTGPALQSEASSKSVADSAPAATGAASNKTQLISESSIDTEEKTEPSEPSEPSEPQISAENESLVVAIEDGEIPAEQPSEELPTLEPPISDTPQDNSTLALPKIDEDIMAEIKQIRDQLGGGIAETLKGVDQMPSFGAIEISPSLDGDGDAATTAKEPSPEDLFNEELRSVMSEQGSKGAPIIGAHRTLQSPRAVDSPMQLPNELAHTDRTQELRSCARELEQLAGRLESIAAYEHADQVRRQAAQLWTTARQQ